MSGFGKSRAGICRLETLVQVACFIFKFGIEPIVELPGVGRNLMNHVGTVMVYNLMYENKMYMSQQLVDEYLSTRSGFLSGIGK